VEELADLKQRLLPQANGRAERAEKARQMAVAERDALLEELTAARKTINQIKLEWEPPPSATAAPNEAAAWKWGYEYLQGRMKTIGRDGWAHDCDSEIEARIDAAPVESATAAPPVWTWALEEGATAWQDAALAHLKVVSVLMSPQDVLRVQNFINDSRMESLPVEETAIGHARYEYLRTLNPRQFAALWNDVRSDDGGNERFDDVVDRRRMKGAKPCN
jgi:hypothetical protein